MQAATVIDFGAYIATAVTLVWAAVSDIRTRRIANHLPLLILSFFMVAAMSKLISGACIMATLVWPIATGLIVLLIGMVLFAARLMGGGDVKLMAAVALFAGPALSLTMVLYITVAGGLVALATMLWHRVFRHESAKMTSVPYGVAIMVGGLWVCFQKISAL